MKEEMKIALEVAIEEVTAFVEYHKEKEIDAEKLNEDYPDVILAVQRGLLTFDEDKVPELVLRQPIKTESGSVAVGTLTFKTRLLASARANLMKGLNLEKDSGAFINKITAYYIGQPVAMLDKLGKFDLRVIDQIVSVF